MFATRSSKTKKNKRKRVLDDEEEGVNGSSRGQVARSSGGGAQSDGDDDADQLIAPIVSDRRKINTFSTGAGKKAKNVVQVRQIESAREIVPQKYAGDATYETQIDTEKDRDARAIMERNIKLNEDGSADNESGKVYKGQSGYKNYISKKESQIGMNKYTGTQGPIRAQTWARAISRFDYQPDICKDYKETGFCGYGDSCKFLHDRGDYKSGWQIEKEWAEKEKKRQLMLQQGRNPDEEDDDDDKYVIESDDEEQFACTICRGPFRNAIETICGHFFCEACALKHFKKTSRCFNCRKQTNGADFAHFHSVVLLVSVLLTSVFNAAEKLRLREQEEREEEENEQSDDDEEEGSGNANEDDDDDGAADKNAEEVAAASAGGGWTVVS